MRRKEGGERGEPMILAATIDLLDPRDRRADTRTTVGRLSTIRDGGQSPRDVIVEDLSQIGFRYRSTDRLPVGTPVRLGLAGAGTAAAQVVRVDGDEHGCAFDRPLSLKQFESAFTSGAVIRTSSVAADVAEIDAGEQWPRAVRMAIFIGGGVAAWGGVVALLKALG